MNTENSQAQRPWWITWSPLIILGATAAFVGLVLVMRSEIIRSHERWTLMAMMLLVEGFCLSLAEITLRTPRFFSLLMLLWTGGWAAFSVDYGHLTPRISFHWVWLSIPISSYLCVSVIACVIRRIRNNSAHRAVN